MAYKTYNNNDKSPTNTTYSAISFSNAESTINPSRISIGYFNKVMKISIANKINNNGNNDFSTYDNDNAVVVYVSSTKAKILYDMIEYMKSDNDVHNVCVELKNGLMKISDGSEFGSTSPCISISYASKDGSVNEIIYQTKANVHNGAYNFNGDSFKTKFFDDIELETFEMVLDEYYRASSYAIAATVMEASMYKRDAEYNMIRSMAEKMGIQNNNSSNPAKFNNRTFLNNQNNTSNNSMIPKEYESSTFDNIVDNMMG